MRVAHPPGRPLTSAQRRVLPVLVELCPQPGDEAAFRQIADQAALRPGAAMQALQGLERRRCAEGHDDGRSWALTWDGRDRARGLAACT